MVAQRSDSMSENRNDGNRVGAPDAIPKRDRLTDAQIDQVRELLAQEREVLAQEREAMLTATGEAVGRLLDQQREELKAYYENTIRALKIEMSALDVTVRELRALINAENPSSSIPPHRRRTGAT
jgi:hypothetical protein